MVKPPGPDSTASASAAEPERGGEPLRALLRRHTLGTALIPLLVVELSLVALYLAFGQEVAGRWRQEVLTGLRQSLHEVVDARARQMALTLTDIEHQTDLVRAHAGQLLRGEVLAPQEYQPELYAVGKSGSLYQRIDDGGASIFYAATTSIGDAERHKIAATEPLDELLRRTVVNDPHVVAAYLNTPDVLSRYYPFIPRMDEQIPADLQMEDFAFFYAADAEHDPERKVVWTEAYLDPAGAGWMVSSVAPVYDGDVLQGVVGLDVTIPVIAERILDLELSYSASTLLLTVDGTLLALDREAAERFEAGAAIFDEPPSGVDRSRERALDDETSLATLLGGEAEARRLREGLVEDTGLLELELGGEALYLVHADIPGPQWKLAVLVSKDEVMAPVEAIESRSRTLALYIIGGMGLFYALFFRLLYHRSRRLAARVAMPLGTLTEAVGGAKASRIPPPCGISEIDRLSQSFREMLEANRAHQARIEALNENLAGQVREEVRKNREKDHLLLEQSRLASLGEMVASIAHQWRQPLSSLQFLVDDLRLQAEEGEAGGIDATALREGLDEAEHLIQHMSGTVDDFRALYREDAGAQRFELRSVVEQALSITDGTLKSAGVAVEIEDHSEGVTIEGRRNELSHVLLNLISNAQAVLSERGVAEPRIVVRIGLEGDTRVIEIEDNAGGIDPELESRLFEPFVTGRRDGTGLGLPMSRRLVVERFGGGLEVREGEAGACFRIELPPRPPAAPDHAGE